MGSKTTIVSDGWQLKNTDVLEIDAHKLDNKNWIPVSVPGGVHPALVAAGQLQDPFFDANENKVSWVEDKTWWYRTVVRIAPAARDERLQLIFKGIDIFGGVFFDGELLGETDNMFREWSFDVTDRVKKEDEHVILVRLLAPKLVLADTKELKLPLLGLAQKNVINNLMRKAQYAYGWDWGPRMPNVGLWRPVELRREEKAALVDVYARTESLSPNHDEATVVMSAEIDTFSGVENLAVQYELRDPTTERVVYSEKVAVDNNVATVRATIKKPKLWWTNDLGEPFLYELHATLLSGAKKLDTQQQKIGIRKLTLNQSPDPDEPGATYFQFVINDVPLFSRGGDWIPLSMFPGDVPDAQYRQRFEDAKNGNFNMLRVWGGGIYEQDIFYNLADEFGMLVWHDFMFANTHYPEDERFQENVKAEIRYQVTRLRRHASLAAWCGNNETYTMIEGLKKVVPWTKLIGGLYYEKIIPDILHELDPDRHYQPSSPYGGATSNSDKAGDIHDWQTWHGFGKNFLGAIVRGPRSESISYTHYAENMGRFMTEFGIHGQPDIETWKRAISPAALYPHSPMLDLHNKDFGKQKMDLMMDLVTGRPRSTHDLETYVMYSQITQGEGLRFGLEHFRRRFPHCSGAVVWQYNDCYPVQSWSLTDYNGFLKGGYYMIRRTYAPVIVTFKKVGTAVEVWLTNNSTKPVEETVSLIHQRFTGVDVWQREVAVSVPALSSQKIDDVERRDVPRDGQTFLWVESAKKTFPANHYFGAPVHELVLPDSAPKLTYTKISLHEYQLQVETSTYLYALRVHHPSEFTRYDDNFVDVRPGETKTITITNTTRPLREDDIQVSWNL